MYAIIFHAHQKIDRAAFAHLRHLIGDQKYCPTLRQILHFEGRNGPDAAKLKNKVSVEPPWHFMNPFDENDKDLPKIIDYHYSELVNALKAKNQTRIAFEMAWLAHALVDGLTPAHHYPYEEALEKVRGSDRINRKTLASHLVVKGMGVTQSILRSFKLIGPKGLLTTHTTFEAGVYTMMFPIRGNRARPKKDDLNTIRTLGTTVYFRRLAREIAALGLYERFYKTGWTPRLGRDVNRELVPRMIMMVTLAWYSAFIDAGIIKKAKI